MDHKAIDRGKALLDQVRDLKRQRTADGLPAPRALWVSNAQMRDLVQFGAAYCDPKPAPTGDLTKLLGWDLLKYDESMPLSPGVEDLVL